MNINISALLILSLFFLTVYSGATLAAKNAASAEDIRNYELPALELSDALTRLAEINDLQIVYPSALTEGFVSIAISGDYTLINLLELLLSRYQLEAIFIAPKVITVREKSSATTTANTGLTDSQVGATNSIERIESVTVTGSRIPRAEYEVLFPTKVISQQVLFRANDTNIGDALEGQAILCPGVQSLSSSGLERNIGSVFPDLYCLDSQRTLTLVNGRRVVPSNTPDIFAIEPGLQFNVNTLPTIMIDRVEIIGVGSAPVYGSDAIAGTINIILNDKFEGFDLDVEGGTSDVGDGDQYRVSTIMGSAFADGRGSFTMAYEFHEQKGIQAEHRKFTAADYTYVPNLNDTGTGDGEPRLIRVKDGTLNAITLYGLPTPLQDIPDVYASPDSEDPNIFFGENGRPLRFDENGRLAEFNLGEPTGNPLISIGGDGERLSDYSTLRNPSRRHVFFGNAQFEFSDALAMFSELHYFNDEARTRTDNVFRSTGLSFNIGIVPQGTSIDSSFLHPEDRALLEPQLSGVGAILDEFYVHKNWSDIYSRENRGKLDLFQFTFGLEGEFSLLNNDWQWQSLASYGESEASNSKPNLDCPQFYGQEFSFICSMDQDSQVYPETQPFGRIDDAAERQRLVFDTVYNTKQEMALFSANINGQLFDLPAGPVEVSLGLERRIQTSSGEQAPAPEDRVGLLNPVPSIDGKFDTKEFSIESLVPLIGANLIPALEELSLESSLRWIEHSSAGGDSAFSVGGRMRFALGDSTRSNYLTLRGNSTRSIRSPSITERDFPDFFDGFQFVSDPCTSDFISQSPDEAALRDNCSAEAVRLGAVNYNPDTFIQDDFDVSNFIVGNQNLKNETARSYTLGLVLTTNDAQGLAISADLVDIEVDNIPGPLSADALLARCYIDGDTQACDRVVRVSQFELIRVNKIYDNLGKLSTRLVQFTLNYPFFLHDKFGIPGDFEVNASGQFVSEYRRDTTLGGANLVGTYGTPKRIFLTSLDYLVGMFDVSWSVEHYSSVQYFITPDPEFVQNNRVDSHTLHHLAARYQINDNFSLRAGINNIFDTQPPDTLASADATSIYAPIGRYYLLGARFSF